MKGATAVQIVVEHKCTVLGIADPQTSQDRGVATLGALDAQAMALEHLLHMLGEGLLVGQ